MDKKQNTHTEAVIYNPYAYCKVWGIAMNPIANGFVAYVVKLF